MQQPIHYIVVAGEKNVTAAHKQYIVQATCNTVRRLAVGQNLGENDLGLPASQLRRDVGKLSGTSFPGIVQQGERGVLGYIYPHVVLSEAAVGGQPFGIFPGGDSTGARAYGLEICIWNAAGLLRETENGGSHTVAAGNVLCASFQEVPWIPGQLLAQGDSVVIITTVGNCNNFNAPAEFPMEPKVVYIILRNTNNYRNIIV